MKALLKATGEIFEKAEELFDDAVYDNNLSKAERTDKLSSLLYWVQKAQTANDKDVRRC